MNLKISEDTSRLREKLENSKEIVSSLSPRLNEFKGEIESMIVPAVDSFSMLDVVLTTILDTINREFGDLLQRLRSPDSEDDGITWMDNMCDEFELSNLQKYSEEIMAVSFRIKLISLNGAIEASRAGESGNAFSVLVQEVKSLSERSSDASQGIFSILKMVNSVLVTSQRRSRKMVEDLSGLVTTLIGDISSVKDNISNIIIGFQFEDITRQTIDHIIHSLDKVAGSSQYSGTHLHMREELKGIGIEEKLTDNLLESSSFYSPGINDSPEDEDNKLLQIEYFAISHIIEVLAAQLKSVKEKIDSSLTLAISSFVQLEDFITERLGFVDSLLGNAFQNGEKAVDPSDWESFINKDLELKEIKHYSREIAEIARSIQMVSIYIALEVAHTGEFEKSFAVIAEDIKLMADKSTGAAENIQRIFSLSETSIDTISEKVGKVIRNLSKIVNYATHNMKKIKQNIHGFIQRLNSVRQMQGSIDDIIKAFLQVKEIINENGEMIKADNEWLSLDIKDTMLKRLEEEYTMERERHIARATLLGISEGGDTIEEVSDVTFF